MYRYLYYECIAYIYIFPFSPPFRLANCIANIIPTEGGDFFCLFSVDAKVCLKFMTTDMKKTWKKKWSPLSLQCLGHQNESSFWDLKFWVIKILAFLGSCFGIKFRFGDFFLTQIGWALDGRAFKGDSSSTRCFWSSWFFESKKIRPTPKTKRYPFQTPRHACICIYIYIHMYSIYSENHLDETESSPKRRQRQIDQAHENHSDSVLSFLWPLRHFCLSRRVGLKFHQGDGPSPKKSPSAHDLWKLSN